MPPSPAPPGQPLQRVQLMLTALAILFLGVSVFAYAWGGQSPWSLPDLRSENPAELLRELREEGMDCHRREGRTEIYDCSYRPPGGSGEPPDPALIAPT